MATLERGEGNETRKKRLEKLKKGPGVFIYNGEAEDTEYVPTPLLTGRKEPLLDDRGLPVTDRAGRQIYAPSGQVVRNGKGEPMLGGIPQIVKHKIEVFVVRGVEFPAGKEVVVNDSSLALKLRGMTHFAEVDAVEAAPEGEEPAPKKRGRPKKGEPSAEE
jgi:hypothetical protein